jgi:hypothetical protein
MLRHCKQLNWHWTFFQATLGKILDNQQMDPTIDDDEEQATKQDTRAVQFCLGMSKWWNNPAHAILKELRNKHGLTWL